MKSIRINLDALGMCASTLCLLHCIALPLLLAVLPMWKIGASEANRNVIPRLVTTDTSGSASGGSGYQCDEQECCETGAAVGDGGDNADQAACCSTPTDFWTHVGLLSTVAPLGLVAWGMGYRKHRRGGVLCLGFTGVLLLIGALLFGIDLWGGRGEQVMTVLGSVCMVSAHLWNRRQCHCCHAPDIAGLVDMETALPASPQSRCTTGGVL